MTDGEEKSNGRRGTRGIPVAMARGTVPHPDQQDSRYRRRQRTGAADWITVLTDTFQALRLFGDPGVAEVTAKSSFTVSDFAAGGPMTVYIELP